MKENQITPERMAKILNEAKAGRSFDEISPDIAKLIPKTIILFILHTLIVTVSYAVAAVFKLELIQGLSHILLFSLLIRLGGSINNIKWVNLTRVSGEKAYQSLLPFVDWEKVERELPPC